MKNNVLIISEKKNCPFSYMIKKWFDYNKIFYEELYVNTKEKNKNIFENLQQLLNSTESEKEINFPIVLINEKIILKGCNEFFKNESFLKYIFNLID